MNMSGWLVSIVVLLLDACAASPTTPAPVAVTAPATAPQKSGGANYTPEELDKRAREMGYHVETRGGQKGYCRNNAPTGSHISRQACLSADAMVRAVKTADDDQDQISQRQMQSSSGGSRLP